MGVLEAVFPLDGEMQVVDIELAGPGFIEATEDGYGCTHGQIRNFNHVSDASLQRR